MVVGPNPVVKAEMTIMISIHIIMIIIILISLMVWNHFEDGDYNNDNDVVHPNDAVQPCHRLDAQVVWVDLDDQAGHEAGEEVTIVRGK